MIKSWIDADTGVKHYADDRSKAYRNRVERGLEPSGTIESGLRRVEVEEAPDSTKRPRVSKPAGDSPS
ncbi:hypothetical protein [Nocardia brasiliensis]|uniref:hypothetical protein n=1 Tax=Nocardia brasiliensis TaxID=37326 RepID=UPI0024545AB2|nr:hypothetical protein [Nocardia brasiliensis]